MYFCKRRLNVLSCTLSLSYSVYFVLFALTRSCVVSVLQHDPGGTMFFSQ